MGMSLADLDEWDPNCVHAVFAALQSHADNTRDIADNLGRLIEGIPWEGDAHDAALAANKGIRDDMHLHAEQLEAVAKASKTAETEIRSIKADWAFLQQEASACGMTIDAGSGTVSYVKSSDPAVAHIQEENYQTIRTEVGKLLKRADQADHHLAAAINGAVGRMSAAGMNNEVSGQDIVGTPKDPGDQGGKLDQGGVAPVPAMTDVPGEPNSQPANLSGALDQLAGAPVPASVTPPPLPAKEVDAFKASARKVLASEGVPPEQIESRLSDVVARAQQQGWGPSYRPPKPERVPAPGFGEGFGDAWRKSEQSIKNLLGQGGPGAPGVLDSWKEMAKGINDVVTNPVGAAVIASKDNDKAQDFIDKQAENGPSKSYNGTDYRLDDDTAAGIVVELWRIPKFV